MTKEHQAVLDQWGAIARVHANMLEFLQWAEREGHIEFKQISLPNKPGSSCDRHFASLSDVLDVYYSIDRRALDNARVALLNEHLEASFAGKQA